MSKNFSIKTMTRAELDFAIELAANEGWNPGLFDGDPFYNADPNGFLIGYFDEKPIGCVSAVSYENKFGFIGFYIIVPEFRGKGYGVQLWKDAMEKLENQNVGLDGVIEQQSNYKKSGFKLAYSNIRFEFFNSIQSFDDEKVFDASQISFDQFKNYDRKFFFADRTAFLKSWLAMPQSFSFAYKNEDEIKGYGVIRKCRSGYKIGPLFADEPDIAEKIFLKLCSSVERKSFIYLDVPEINSAGIRLAEKFGMKKVFCTARMYTGEFPNLPVENIFGVTTFELG